MRSYILTYSDRILEVVEAGHYLDDVSVTYGVTHSLPLGPPLVLWFKNELPNLH